MTFPLTTKGNELYDATGDLIATFPDGPVTSGADRAEMVKSLANRGWTAGTRVVAPTTPEVTIGDDPNAPKAECVCAPDGSVCCDAVFKADGFEWFCTRPQGHEGPHFACGVNIHRIATSA